MISSHMCKFVLAIMQRERGGRGREREREGGRERGRERGKIFSSN